MPRPVCWYHVCPSGLTPAAFQSASSLLCVPDLSARETKVPPFAPIALSASTVLVDPLIFAGSAAGPTMTKSLCITRRRFGAEAVGP